MAKNINDLYCESQIRVAQLEEQLAAEQMANLSACRAIQKLCSGELQTSKFVVTEADGRISWSFVDALQEQP